MHDVSEFFSKLFSPDSWPARWNCGRWTPFHGWLYIISNILIAIAYFSIPLILFYVIKKTKNKLPFQKIFWLFLIFILACGFTHVFDALMFWYPVYRMSAIALFITAVVSCAAVVGLYKIIPGALALKSPVMLEKIIRERTEELDKSNKYLTKINLQLEESQKAAEKLMKQKDEFLSIASHELKTPVTSLKAYTQILSMHATHLDDEKKGMISKMDSQINKLTTLINDLLDTTKLEEGILVYKNEKINLDEIVKEIIVETQSTALQHTIIISQIMPAQIMGDKERIRQVINNLITNSIKYSPNSEEIIIDLTTENNMAIFSIQDFGIGIPNEQIEKVFEKFYRVVGENVHTFPGMGLGLYIAADIIKRHGGKLWVKSENSQGSTFYFSLPVAG